MAAAVRPQVATRAVPAAAHVAAERLVAGVSQQVRPEVLSAGKALATLVAGVLSPPAVAPLVAPE